MSGDRKNLITYNRAFLDSVEIFTKNELEMLEDLNNQLSLKEFLASKNLVESFGFDFVYTSAKIEGNAYTKADAITLLEYGRTSGGKRYSDAKMLINLDKAFRFILTDDGVIGKHKIRTIHQILADDLIEKEDIGAVRKKGVTIKGSNYIPLADSIILENELDRVIEISKTIKNPYNKALYLHNNLAYLQYFADVNKRTARTILNLSLKSDGKMLLIPSEEDISLYVDGILEYYENGTNDKSKEFFIKSYQNIVDKIKFVRE
ncbi:MAG: Fic family protein [Sulfurimonadaceae bacterium]|jgi:Fic family protein|nr:Fic family protein [Sulfurimonadaceae bacterium]